MSIQYRIEELLPLDWQISNLIRLNDDDWQVNISDGEHVVVATGQNIEYALGSAYQKAHNGEFAGRLFSLGRMYREPTRPTLSDLIKRKPIRMNRRI